MLPRLERELRAQMEGEVRFDAVSRALYSTDASVYRIVPLGVVVVKSREDLIRIVRIATEFRCPITLRGGGTAQAGQSIGAGLQVDTSKYYNRILELNVAERWVRVEPGIVLDELNAQLKPHGLRFAPDVSTASRAAIGGMMANNSSGARSVLYGKTIDHVIAQQVVLADGTVATFGPLSADELQAALQGEGQEAQCYRTVARVASECADEVERRFPKVIRRVGGYNLDEFIDPKRPFNLAKMMVGSEGTLGVVLEATLNLVPLPKAKAVLVVQFKDLLEALGSTPRILLHKPSAVEVMDKFLLDHTYLSPNLQRVRETFIEGDPGAILCIEFYDDAAENLPPRLAACERDLASNGLGYRYFHALELPVQARVWNLREAALGLSMTMKEDSKSLSFVEDTAVAPEKLRDYIERFLALIRKHNTTAGIYAHASVGCLHVRPVVNMKTAEGVRKFEAIANEVADLVLEFGGALSGEHGDGLVRSPFMQKMFGPVLYEAFRTIKRTFDPNGIFNPGKIVDSPPLTENLRFGAGYVSPNPRTYFDYSEYGGMGGAVEMCSGVGACRKTLAGNMCPSYMATREESDSTRGRANVLRMAISGRLDEAGLGDQGPRRIERSGFVPRMPRMQNGVPGGRRHGAFQERISGGLLFASRNAATSEAAGQHRSPVEMGQPFRSIVELDAGAVYRFAPQAARVEARDVRSLGGKDAQLLTGRPSPYLTIPLLTNHYEPEIGAAAVEVTGRGGCRVSVAPPGVLRTSANLARLTRRGKRERGETDCRAVSDRGARRENPVLRTELFVGGEGGHPFAAAR